MTDKIKIRNLDDSIIQAISDRCLHRMKQHIRNRLASHERKMIRDSKINNFDAVKITTEFRLKLNEIDKKLDHYSNGLQGVYDKFTSIEYKLNYIIENTEFSNELADDTRVGVTKVPAG